MCEKYLKSSLANFIDLIINSPRHDESLFKKGTELKRMCFSKLILKRQNYDRLGHGNGQVARERNILGRDVTYEATRTLSTTSDYFIAFLSPDENPCDIPTGLLDRSQ